MFNRIFGNATLSPTAPEIKELAKNIPTHYFFKKAEAKQIASDYSGLVTQDEINAKRDSSVLDISPVSLSRSSAESQNSDSEVGITEESVEEEVDKKSSRSSSQDSERQSPIRATTPSGFRLDFTRGIYTFSDLTAAGTLEEQKLSIESDEPREITASLLPYFRQDNIAKQAQRIGQALSMGALPYLMKISKPLEPYNPVFHIDFIRVKGKIAEADRFFIRCLLVNDTLQDQKDDITYKFADDPSKSISSEGIKNLQLKMRAKNQQYRISERAFYSVDEIYELSFNDQVNQGPDFFCFHSHPPILSVYSSEYASRQVVASFTDTREAIDPADRLAIILQKIATRKLEFDFGEARILGEEKRSQSKEKLSTKEDTLKKFDISLNGQNKRGYGTLCDHMPIHVTIQQHVESVFAQIQDNRFPKQSDFISKNRQHEKESIFDDQGNLQAWVLEALSPLAPHEKEGLLHYLTDIFTIARKGIQTDTRKLQPWLDSHFGTNLSVQPTKSRLTQAEELLGEDLLSGCLMMSLAHRLSSIPLSLAKSSAAQNAAMITMKLIEHQNSTNTLFLDEAKKLKNRLGGENDFQYIPQFKHFFLQIDAALKKIPLGDTGKLIVLIKLVSKILELDPNSIAYFYAVENFKEQISKFNNKELVAVQQELEKKELPTDVMRSYSIDKFKTVLGEHKSHSLIKKVAEQIELKSKQPLRQRKPKAKKRQVVVDSDAPAKKADISIKWLSLIYQLAIDEKKIEFATQMFTLIEQEESLADKPELNFIFQDAIAEYNKSLTNPALNPNKFTALLKLINTILELDDEARDYLLPHLSIIVDDFNKIKDDPASLDLFNVYITKLQETLPGDEEAEELHKRFAAFIALTVSKGIEDVFYSKECKELKQYEHATQGWTMWLLTLVPFIGLHDKGHDIEDFIQLLTSKDLEDNLVFFQTIQAIALGNKKNESKLEVDRESTMTDAKMEGRESPEKDEQEQKEVDKWQKKLTKIRNPIYQIYQFFGGTVAAKSTVEQKIVALYEKKKDTINDVLKKLPKVK